MLSCREWLARHSEYLDGTMDAVSVEQWRTHLANCPTCARYDRVLRAGLALLAAQPPADATPDFSINLQQRLALEERRIALRPMTSLATASVVLAAMLAFAAWVPVLMLSRAEDPSVSLEPIASASSVASEIAWHAEHAVDRQLPAHVHQARRVAWQPRATPVIEPKYTPVILESPIAPLQYTRTVAYDAE